MSTATSGLSQLTTLLRNMDFNNLQNLTPDDLNAAIREETERRKKEIEDFYGSLFSNIVGAERILSLPTVTAIDLSLENPGKYPQCTVLTKHLPNLSAVRGMDGWDRPFIAIKIEVFDYSKKKICEVVELIFKRYGIKGDGKKGRIHEDNFVTALTNRGGDGETYNSTLYSSGGMIDAQIQAVRDLLDGKEIKAPVTYGFGEGCMIRMVKV